MDLPGTTLLLVLVCKTPLFVFYSFTWYCWIWPTSSCCFTSMLSEVKNTLGKMLVALKAFLSTEGLLLLKCLICNGHLVSLDSSTCKGKEDVSEPRVGLQWLPVIWQKPGFAEPVLGSAGAQAAASGVQLERSSTAQHRRAKKQGGWSVGSWNLAMVLCWEFLHLQKLPWYFNNWKWFNSPSGRQQH